MTRTIFLVTGIVLTALAVAVPSALGQGGRATVPFGPVIHDHGDATQAKLELQSRPLVVRDHGDATQAKLTRLSAPVIAGESVRDHGDAEQAKLAAQSPGTASAVESTSNWELSWSELGIGLGVGIFLVGGLILAVQFTRNQRLAH